MTNDTSIEKNTCTINFCIMRWHFAVFQALCSNINHFKLKAYRFKAICPLGYDSRRAWSIAVLREQAFSTLIIWRFEINYEHSVTTKTKTIIARATSTKPSPLTINETHLCGALIVIFHKQYCCCQHCVINDTGISVVNLPAFPRNETNNR